MALLVSDVFNNPTIAIPREQKKDFDPRFFVRHYFQIFTQYEIFIFHDISHLNGDSNFRTIIFSENTFVQKLNVRNACI